MSYPISLGTVTTGTPANGVALTLPSPAFANQLFVLVAFGDQTEDVVFSLDAAGTQPVNIAPAGARIEIGPYAAAVFPRFVHSATGVNVTLGGVRL